MKFSGIDVAPNLRSGLHIIDERPDKAKDGLDLEFFLRFVPDRKFNANKAHKANYGYVFRLVLGDQHLDLVHGFLMSDPDNFKLISGDQLSNFSFSIPIEELWTDWLKLRIELDIEDRRIICHVNEEIITRELGDFDLSRGYRLMFGSNSFGRYTTNDVPGMIIRDVMLSYNKKSWHWPLDETEGSIAHSLPSGNNVITTNPGWLLKEHNSWKPLISKSISGKVQAAFDTKHDKLYLLSHDSIYIYSISDDFLFSHALRSPLPRDAPNHLIFDTISNQLLLYSLMDDYQSVFNPETHEWSPFTPGIERLTDHWHHNRMFTAHGDLLIFGGYGHHKYLNEIRQWNADSGRFTRVEYQGEYQPRYLAASGFNPNDSLSYILGGWGSKSGNQSMSPDYYYELLSYSLKEDRFDRVIEFPNAGGDFCFSNSAYIDESNSLYALRFSKHTFENKLQLVQIPLEKAEVIELGNEIDYTFLDVASFSDLHFSKSIHSLVALSSYTANGHTQVSIHSIAFPPQPFKKELAESGKNAEKTNILFGLLVGISLLSLLVASLLFYRKRNTVRKSVQNNDQLAPIQKKRENSIILFGGFQVFDKTGQDITGQFSPLLRKLLLFILLHTLRDDKGVSDNSLHETFWFDKATEDARNNRSVNVIKVKNILEKLDNTTISKDSGYHKFIFNASDVYIDYDHYLQIFRKNSELSREQMDELLSIIDNSPLLKNTNADWLDPFKSELSNKIIDALLNYIDHSDETDADYLLNLTNCIFMCDTVSEEALRVQCRLLVKQGKLSLAKNSYTRFVKEYKALYDEDYNQSFKQILAEL
jgi:DNA-binding SARP family transcriptional activator